MWKKKDDEVRCHEQEREWLRNLGGGDLVEGARNLIEQLLDKRDKDHYEYYPERKRGLFGRWRN